MVNSDDDSVTVLVGIGGSRLPERLVIRDPGSLPLDVAVGDYNNDRKQDLVVANNGADSVGVFLGDGAGGFAARIDTGTGRWSTPASVAVGDFNRDHKQDLVVATASYHEESASFSATAPAGSARRRAASRPTWTSHKTSPSATSTTTASRTSSRPTRTSEASASPWATAPVASVRRPSSARAADQSQRRRRRLQQRRQAGPGDGRRPGARLVPVVRQRRPRPVRGPLRHHGALQWCGRDGLARRHRRGRRGRGDRDAGADDAGGEWTTWIGLDRRAPWTLRRRRPEDRGGRVS